MRNTGRRGWTGDQVQQYCDSLKHQHALLARRGQQATHYPASVATTWSLSFAYVEQTNPAAAELLRLSAFLAPDHIPEELLTDGAPYWPPALQEAVADRFHFNQLVEVLMAFSLVKRLAEDEVLSLHRLVQVVQRERLSSDEQRQWVEWLVRAIQAIFPADPREVTSWPQCQRLLEQVQACDALIHEQEVLLPEAANLLDRAGIYLFERGLYALAEPLFQQALHIWDRQVPPDPVGSARSLNKLATLFLEQGKYTEAEPLLQSAIDMLEPQEESEPVLLASLLQNLGHLHLDRGEAAQAEPLYRRALRLLEQQVPEHPAVIGLLRGLAWTLMEQGRYPEAELLSQRALQTYEEQVSPESQQVGDTLRGLAELYTGQREYSKAEPLYRRALRIREDVVSQSAVWRIHDE